jgi:uncharacterized membrane protein YphA (DoxX/SURF4 family)
VNILLWTLQGLLAAAFAVSGTQKAFLSRERLISHYPWVEDFSTPTVRFIAIAELLGALGLVLPPLTAVAPILAPIAASALGVVMLLAMLTHVRRHEMSAVALNPGAAGDGRHRRLGTLRRLGVPGQDVGSRRVGLK